MYGWILFVVISTYHAIALCLYVNGRRRIAPPEEIWLELSEKLKDAYREQAKAAIAAMEDLAAITPDTKISHEAEDSKCPSVFGEK